MARTPQQQELALAPVVYDHVNRSGELGTPLASGPPTTAVHSSTRVQNIVYRDTSGRLHELCRDAAGQVGTSNLTAAAGAPKAAGDPFAYLDTRAALELVVFRGEGSGVHSLYWSTGPVGLDNLSAVARSPRAAGNPVGTFNGVTNTHHVVYRSGDGHLHVLYWTGAEDRVGYDGPLTGAVDAPLAAGDASAYLTSSGQNVVVYRAKDARIHDLYWSTGAVGHSDLSGVAGTPPAVGDPIAYYIPTQDAHQVTYRGRDGHVYELFWRGEERVAGWDLTAMTGAPVAESDPATYYSVSTNTKHVVYTGSAGHLYEIRWRFGGHPEFLDLTRSAQAPEAAGRPAAFSVEGPNTHYVVYRGIDKQIHEIFWSGTPLGGSGFQNDWGWCNKCQGLFYGGNVGASRCPTGGTHTPPDQSRSFAYVLSYGAPNTSNSQGDWRWCNKCQGLFYGGNVAASRCPTGGTHAPATQSGSFDYFLNLVTPLGTPVQADWRWCNKCQGLFYGGNVAASRCPTGGTHAPATQSGSFDYRLSHIVLV